MTTEHVDVLIVGAGLSGIGAAYYIQTYCPNKTYAVIEARAAMGGTWDLFRYPGVRSDSDMYTLGYTFHPWRNPKAIADGPSILAYIHETAETYGIDRKIRYGNRMCGAAWSSADARWTVDVQRHTTDGQIENIQITCNFLYLCMGYYDYDQGYLPQWDGYERFQGRIVHPQGWDEALDYTGKRVVVIGSGATAVTLVPAMAEKAAHVTMLQRSPTYVVSLPAEDTLANTLRRWLPGKLAYLITRWRIILLNIFFYRMTRWKPEYIKRTILDGVRKELGEDYPVDQHFSPSYNPWDQRLCLVPDADLFKAIKSGKASVVTDQIETFTEDGIRLRSGEQLRADIIVTATGLVLKLAKGGDFVVDGQRVDLPQTMNYKGAMLSDVPNMAFAFGYTNASWTLKCELTSRYVCRLLNYMDAHGYQQATPRRTDTSVTQEPILDFSSGYVQRAIHTLPVQGSKRPWKLYQNYLLDLVTMQFGKVDDGTMEFRQAASAAPPLSV
jgi:cation diffusion facilitator CzcD-associated flavoprotein CzcO